MIMAPLSQIQSLRHTARAALSRSRRPLLTSSSSPSPSPVHLLTDHDGVAVRTRHQKRPLSTSSIRGTRPLYALPNKFVTGTTPEQVAESQAVRDWYASNFEQWEDDPDKIIVGEEKEEEEDEAAAAAEEEDSPSIISLPEHLTKRNIRPLVAYLRESGKEEGTRNCRRLRNPGVNDPNFPLTPGILHGSDPTKNIVSVDHSSKVLIKTPWFEIQRELDRYHYGVNGSFENRVYALTVFPSDEAHLDHHRGRQPKDRTTYKVDDVNMTITAISPPPLPTPPPRTPVEGMENILVIPADLQMHPVMHAPFCLNFVRYHPNKPIKIRIQYVNEEESPALKRGGFLAPVNRFVECLVEDGAPIPECIELECTGLRQKDVVRRERLIVPEGVTIHPRVPDDFLIGTVFGGKGGGNLGLGDEDAEGEGGEEK